jgi:hypothetical protein
MFGGANVVIPGVVPSDIVIERNILTKDPAWQSMSWTVKNLFELKSGRRVIVRGNLLQYNWGGSQAGFAVVLTPRNSSGLNPWVVVEDVDFSGNVVAHSGSAFNLLGYDDTAISGRLSRVTIRNNLVFDMTGGRWAGSGIFAQIGGEPRDIFIDHNTVLHDGNIVTFYSGSYTNTSGIRVTGGPILGFMFTNNLLKHNTFGIFGSGQAFGSQTLTYYAPGAIVQRNVMASDKVIASRYPADNLFPSVASFLASFENAAALDYRLAAGSPFVAAGTDGQNLGCDFTTLLMMSPPVPPRQLRITDITR